MRVSGKYSIRRGWMSEPAGEEALTTTGVFQCARCFGRDGSTVMGDCKVRAGGFFYALDTALLRYFFFFGGVRCRGIEGNFAGGILD